jgi:hypothetical protein
MSFDIGRIIKKLVKDNDLPTADVGNAINASKQTVYKVYKRRVIDSEKLIKLSVLLKTNLFSYFRGHELLKDLPDPVITRLENEIEQQKKLLNEKDLAITEKDKQIIMLDQLNTYQQSEIKKFKNAE